MKKAFSLKRLSSAFKYAFKGFGKVYKNEDNMKVHVVVAILVVLCGFLFKVSTLEWIILIFAIGLVIGAEVLNTCIENLVDLVTKDYNKYAENAKDTAADHTLVLSITAAIIGLIVFIPKLIDVIGG